MRLGCCALLVAMMAVAGGCEGNISTAPETAEVDTGAPAPPAPAPPAGAAQADAAEPDAEAMPDEEPAAGAESPAAAPAEGDGTAEEAKVGVGVKGRDYGGPGFITTPIQEYFRTGERIAFEIQIPNAMKIYKAEHNDKGPKTHEEFMDIIIKENGVQLPDLAEGEEFSYDPQTEQLMVKHPVK